MAFYNLLKARKVKQTPEQQPLLRGESSQNDQEEVRKYAISSHLIRIRYLFCKEMK